MSGSASILSEINKKKTGHTPMLMIGCPTMSANKMPTIVVMIYMAAFLKNTRSKNLEVPLSLSSLMQTKKYIRRVKSNEKMSATLMKEVNSRQTCSLKMV